MIRETECDRQAELEIARQFASAYKFRAVHQLKKFYEVDLALLDGLHVACFAEAKDRHHALTAYSTLMISAHKWEALRRLAPYAAIGSVLIVRWRGGEVGYVPVVEPRPARLGGRQDRDDASDIEPVVHVPIREFTLLK